MRIDTRFAVAVHILALLALGGDPPPTSEMMAGSVGTHPVVVRQVMGALKKAGLIETRSGVPGGHLARPEGEISLFEIYQAVKRKTDAPLFDFHPQPNPLCPVGRNIREAMDLPLANAQAAMEESLKGGSLKDVTAHIVMKETGGQVQWT